MSAFSGWTVITVSLVALGVAAVVLRRNLSGTAFTIAAGAAGVGVGLGGLAVVGDVGAASWVMAPSVLAVASALQVKALFAPGGPFRT